MVAFRRKPVTYVKTLSRASSDLQMTIVPRRVPYRRALLGGILFALGAGSNITLRMIYDTRPAYVNVRWAPSVDDEGQQRLEQRYGLIMGEFRENRTWGYYLTDLSRTNIEALVRDPMVEDTHQLDRQAFRVLLRAARARDIPPDPEIPRTYELLSLSALVVGGLAMGWAWIDSRLPPGVRRRLFRRARE